MLIQKQILLPEKLAPCAHASKGVLGANVPVLKDVTSAGTVEHQVKHPNHCGLDVSATGAMSLEQTPQQGSVQVQVQASHSRHVS